MCDTREGLGGKQHLWFSLFCFSPPMVMGFSFVCRVWGDGAFTGQVVKSGFVLPIHHHTYNTPNTASFLFLSFFFYF